MVFNIAKMPHAAALFSRYHDDNFGNLLYVPLESFNHSIYFIVEGQDGWVANGLGGGH